MISDSPKCTHPTKRHTFKLIENPKPMGPALKCVDCSEKFMILSEKQFNDIREYIEPFVKFIPPIENN